MAMALIVLQLVHAATSSPPPPPVSGVIYALSQRNDSLLYYDKTGALHMINSGAPVAPGFNPIGPQQTCIDADEAIMYMLALNRTAPITMLLGVSLSDALIHMSVVTPIVQQGALIGAGETIDCVGNGVVIVTGQVADGKHAAFEIAPSIGSITPLASGFLSNETLQLLDYAHTLQLVRKNTKNDYIMWLVVAAATPPNTWDLVAIDLRSGATTQRLHIGGTTRAVFPHTLSYDQHIDALIAVGLATGLSPLFFSIDAKPPHKYSVLATIPHGYSVMNGLSTYDSKGGVAYTLVDNDGNGNSNGGGGGGGGGQLIVGVCAATKAVTEIPICPGGGCGSPFNIDFF